MSLLQIREVEKRIEMWSALGVLVLSSEQRQLLWDGSAPDRRKHGENEKQGKKQEW